MILKRYGATVQSVERLFEPHALTEIGFRRDGRLELSSEEFEARYRKVEERELSPEATGWVQSEAEAELLDRLGAIVDGLEENLGEGEVLLVENEPGVDPPKTRETREAVVVEGQNRYRFHQRVDPALRIGVYRREE